MVTNDESSDVSNIMMDPGLQDDDGNELPRPFTKNQMRKWLKKSKWVNRKSEKRAREKLRAKQKKIEAKINNVDLGESRKALKRRKMQDSHCTMGVIIDLSFDHLMIEKDRFKVIKQILRCYSVNRRSTTPLQFYITSFGERTKNEISRHNGYENWDVKFKETPYIDLFPKENLVYLTSESENVLETFDNDCYYIIGGLVDHNQHKGLCHKIACEQGIKHARLPLDKYINMKTRKVLTIDHVFEIILRVSEGVTWPETLMRILPSRKGASLQKTSNDDANDKHTDIIEENTDSADVIESAH